MKDRLPHVVDDPTEQDALALLNRMMRGVYPLDDDEYDGDNVRLKHGIGWSYEGKTDGLGMTYRNRLLYDDEVDTLYMSVEQVELAET